MAGSIATAYVQVMPSMQGIKGQLEKGFGAEATGGGKSFGANLVKTAMGVIASAKIGEALWSTLNAGAELEQNLGGVQAVYGQFASSITASAEKAYSQMGLSASDYMATANKMGSLFQGSGLTQQRAMELTTQAMQRAADVASVMGIDTTMAMESIAGAAKGNFTMMDNLGVAMNATTLEAYALEKGINFDWNTADQAQKAELAMEMFFDRTNQYAGNFEREASETFSGAFDAMKASAQNVLGNLALGEDITPSLQALAQTTGTFITGNLIPMVLNILTGLPGAIGTLLTALMPADVMGIVTSFVTSFSTFLSGQLPTLVSSGAQLLTTVITGFLGSLPSLISTAGTMVMTLMTAIVTAAPQLLSSGVQLVLSLVQGLISSAPNIVASAATLVSNLLTTFTSYLPDLLAQGISMIGNLVAGLISMIPDAITAAINIIKNIANTFGETDWISIGRDIIDGIASGIRNAAGAIISAAKEAAMSAFNAAKSALGINSPSKVFRDGVGRWIPAGIAVGIRNRSGLVTDAISDLTSQTQAEFNAALRVAPARGGAGSPQTAPGGKVVNFVQNVYAQAQTAAELAQETRYQAEMKVLFGV